MRRVTSTWRGDYLHLRVHDGSAEPPVAVSQPDGQIVREHGRGLPIVALYSTAWGFVINSTGTGKVVWTTLRIRPLGS